MKSRLVGEAGQFLGGEEPRVVFLAQTMNRNLMLAPTVIGAVLVTQGFTSDVFPKAVGFIGIAILVLSFIPQALADTRFVIRTESRFFVFNFPGRKGLLQAPLAAVEPSAASLDANSKSVQLGDERLWPGTGEERAAMVDAVSLAK